MSIQPEYANIVAFGDSLSDSKNAFSLTMGFIPPESLYFEGRFSNGFVAIEQLAEKLGLLLDPYYDTQSGNNFAVGGARTGRDNSNNDDLRDFGIVLPGLTDQIDTFLTSLNGQTIHASTLYSIWVGPNDYLDFLAGSSADDPSVLLDNSMHNIGDAVTRLNDAGATQFLIPNTTLGRLPFSFEFKAEADGISQAFNASLILTLDRLERDKNINVFEIDVYQLSERIARSPASFGFKNITDPFLELGIIPPDPTQKTGYFFWDVFHPTSEGHAVFADAFYQELTGRSPQVSPNLVEGSDQNNVLRGTQKADSIYGLSGYDLILGRAGNDRINGDRGSDRIFGNRGADILSGDYDQDFLYGGSGEDIVLGGEGHDRLWGQAHHDIAIGGAGHDGIKGGSGKDYLLGGRGQDIVWGQSHDDTLHGGEGNDLLIGGLDDDSLEGGIGNDTLLGGKGSDIVRYRNLFENFIFKGNSKKFSITGVEGRDSLHNIETLQFADRIVDVSDLTFFPPLHSKQ